MEPSVSFRYSADPDDHHPLITLRAEHRMETGGEWKEYSVGCICGWYGTPTPGWYIPSAGSAARLYQEHFIKCVSPTELPIPEEDEEYDEEAGFFFV